MNRRGAVLLCSFTLIVVHSYTRSRCEWCQRAVRREVPPRHFFSRARAADGARARGMLLRGASAWRIIPRGLSPPGRRAPQPAVAVG